MHNLLITSYLEPEHIETIRAVNDQINVIYRPDLIAPPRYAADHVGGSFLRTPEQEVEWQGFLKEAHILFDFDRTHLKDLPDLVPNLRWVQGTSAGIGQLVYQNDYPARLPNVMFTTASGVHAKPLAEFCLMTMLMQTRRHALMLSDQRARRWERFAGTDLDGRTLVIVGMGNIGREVARLASAFGMFVIGLKQNVDGITPESLHVDELYTSDKLNDVLPKAEFLVLVVPHTPQTEHMMSHYEFDLLPDNAYLINIGRGAVIDEAAMIDALKTDKLMGAALDVFEVEPLPQNSPLWDMPNVLICSHSASTSDRENGRITELFCDNIHRYLVNEPLHNLLNTKTLY